MLLFAFIFGCTNKEPKQAASTKITASAVTVKTQYAEINCKRWPTGVAKMELLNGGFYKGLSI